MLRHKADVVAHISLAEGLQFNPVQQRMPLRIAVKLPHHHRQGALATSGKPHHRQLLSWFHLKRYLIEKMHVTVNCVGQVRNRYFSSKLVGLTTAGRFNLKLRRIIEIAHDLIVPHPAVLQVLVVIHQLLPWIVEFFISRQKSHQGTQIELSAYAQIAADEKQRKWSQTLEKVVDEFDEKFRFVHPMAERKQRAPKAIQFFCFDTIARISVNLVHACDRFADGVAHGAGDVDALLIKAVVTVLQHRDDKDLQRVYGKAQNGKQRIEINHVSRKSDQGENIDCRRSQCTA